MQRRTALLCALAAVSTTAFSAPPVPVRPGIRPLRAINDEIIESPTFYADELCVEDDECAVPDGNQFCVAVLGDLHMDPRKMDDYVSGREHVVKILEDAQGRGVETAVVSLGDLGESKSIDPENTAELFYVTSACH